MEMEDDFEIIQYIDYKKHYYTDEIENMWNLFLKKMEKENIKYLPSIHSFEIIDTYDSFINNNKFHPSFSVIFKNEELWNVLDEYTKEQLWFQAEKDIHRMKITINTIPIQTSNEIRFFFDHNVPENICKKVAYLCSQTFLAKPFIMLQEFIWKTYGEKLFIASSPHHIYIHIFIAPDNTLQFILHKKLCIKKIHTHNDINKDSMSTLFHFYLSFKNNTMTLFSPKDISFD